MAAPGTWTHIPIYKGREWKAVFVDYAFIDLGDFDKVALFSWRLHIAGFAVTVNGNIKVLIHWLIMGHKEIDHINRDRLDNRRHNLRSASQAENKQNATLRSDNASGFRGVFWATQQGKWCAGASLNGQRYHLGFFTDVEEAGRVA